MFLLYSSLLQNFKKIKKINNYVFKFQIFVVKNYVQKISLFIE